MVEVKENGAERVFEVECEKCKSVLTFRTGDVLTGTHKNTLFKETIEMTKEYIRCPICRNEVSVNI